MISHFLLDEDPNLWVWPIETHNTLSLPISNTPPPPWNIAVCLTYSKDVVLCSSCSHAYTYTRLWIHSQIYPLLCITRAQTLTQTCAADTCSSYFQSPPSLCILHVVVSSERPLPETLRWLPTTLGTKPRLLTAAHRQARSAAGLPLSCTHPPVSLPSMGSLASFSSLSLECLFVGIIPQRDNGVGLGLVR